MSIEIVMNWAVQTGLDISILIVLVLLCRRPFVKLFGARAAYTLWMLPLMRLILPETPITIPRPDWMQSVSLSPTEIITYTNVSTVITSPASTPINWQLPVLGIWLGVALIWFSAQLLRQNKYINRVRASITPVSEGVALKQNQVCKSLALKREPQIYMASSNVGPFVTGIIKPVIILPCNFEKQFTERQQFFALMHELAHIKRGDLWAALGVLLFRALNWPNPLVHFAALKFRTDQEAACDAYVLNMIGGGKKTTQNYAATLLHSAKIATQSTTNSTRTSTNRLVLANPLCLTIYHPLKERLMTLKMSKNNSTILSRIGVGAFFVAALAATAPITIAADGPKAEEPKITTESKKVMKWVEKKDGTETTKHIEVTVKDGVTTAYRIDEDGNKTEIEASALDLAGDFEGYEGLAGLEELEGLSDMNVFVTDDKHGEKHIKILDGSGENHKIIIKEMKGKGGKHEWIMDNGSHSKVFIKRMSKGDDGTTINLDNDVMVFSGEGNHAASMVGAAQRLLERAETMTGEKELSTKARKKLDKARKALKEAQAALEAEQ